MPLIDNIGKECLALIYQKLSKEISSEEYYRALKDLAIKYPRLDFNPVPERARGGKQKNRGGEIDKKMMSAGRDN